MARNDWKYSPNGTGVDWLKIKSYAEQIIPIIRKNDPDGIILIGTPAWASLGISDGKVAHGLITQPLNKKLSFKKDAKLTKKQQATSSTTTTMQRH